MGCAPALPEEGDVLLAKNDLPALNGAVSLLVPVLFLVALVVAWLIYREPARVWWDQMLEGAKAQQGANRPRSDEE